MSNYNSDKWGAIFPKSVSNVDRPSEAINDGQAYNTSEFPQFIETDPVKYTLQNAFLTQLFSNDARLNDKIEGINQTTVKGLQEHRTATIIDHPDASVTTAKLRDNSVTTTKIADDNVTTPKIADRNVTTNKIAYNAVGTDELKDDVFNNHNTDINAHQLITDMISNILGTDNWREQPVSTLKNIKNLLGFGGIVAQRLETNGYVKFANGFTIQWGTSTCDRDGTIRAVLPIAYTKWKKYVGMHIGGDNAICIDLVSYQALNSIYATIKKADGTTSEGWAMEWISVGV